MLKNYLPPVIVSTFLGCFALIFYFCEVTPTRRFIIQQNVQSNPSIALKVFVVALKYGDLDGLRSIAEESVVKDLEGVTQRSDYRSTQIYLKSVQWGTDDSGDQNSWALWRKWGDYVKLQNVKWLPVDASSSKKSPVFQNDESIFLTFGKQLNGGWVVTDVEFIIGS